MRRAIYATASVCVAAMLGSASLSAGASGVRIAKKCKASEVKQSATYKKKKGGRAFKVKGCGPRLGAIPKTLPGALTVSSAQSRRITAGLLPASIARLRRGVKARRVLAAAAATDRALAAGLVKVPKGRALAKPKRPASVSAVTRESGSATVAGPPGTQSTMTATQTHRDGAEPRSGVEMDVETRTTSTGGPPGSSRVKTVSVKALMDQCPDASGIARGPVDYRELIVTTVGQPDGGSVVERELATFIGQIVVQFGEDAHIASAAATGEWSWDRTTSRSSGARGRQRRVSHHGAGGGFGIEPGSLHQGNTGTSVDFSTTVTTATDPGSAISGNYLGLLGSVMPNSFIKPELDKVQARALSGACVRIVADPTAVKVTAGSSAPVKAHFVAKDGTTFAGRITAAAGAGTVTPSAVRGEPTATFTYKAPSPLPANFKSYVRFDGASKRGKAGGTIVDVTGDPRLAGRVIIDAVYNVDPATLDEGQTATGSLHYRGEYDVREDGKLADGTLVLVGSGTDALNISYSTGFVPEDPYEDWTQDTTGSASGTATRTLTREAGYFSIVPAGAGQAYLNLEGLLSRALGRITLPNATAHTDMTQLCRDDPPRQGDYDYTATSHSHDFTYCPVGGDPPRHDVDSSESGMPGALPGQLLYNDGATAGSVHTTALCDPAHQTPWLRTCPFAFASGQPLVGSFTGPEMRDPIGGICTSGVDSEPQFPPCTFPGNFGYKGKTTVSWDLKPS